MSYIFSGAGYLEEALLISIPIYILAVVILMITGGMGFLKKRYFLVREFLFLAYIIAVIGVTGIMDAQWMDQPLNAFDKDFLNGDRKEMALNVLMFVPMGIFLPWLVFRSRRCFFLTVMAGFILSFAIEYSQMYIPGRVSDVNDLIFNTEGTLIGYMIYSVAAAIQDHSEDTCYLSIFAALGAIFAGLQYEGSNICILALNRFRMYTTAWFVDQYIQEACLALAAAALIISVVVKARGNRKRSGLWISILAVLMTGAYMLNV